MNRQALVVDNGPNEGPVFREEVDVPSSTTR